MKKQIVLLSALAAACAVAQVPKAEMHSVGVQAFGGRPMGVEAMMGGTVKGQPYSADVVSESIQVLADGTRITNRNSAFVARDSQGRTRHETSLNVIGNVTPHEVPKIIMIHDPQANVTYTLEPRSKTARKMSSIPVHEGEAGMTTHFKVQTHAGGPGEVGSVTARTMQMKVRQAGKSQVESLGSKIVEGVMADGKRITEAIAAGEIGNDREIHIVNEVWTAQDLKAVVYSKRTDPRTGEMIYRLTNIQRAEPPTSLFEVPADYKIEEGVPQNFIMIRDKD